LELLWSLFGAVWTYYVGAAAVWSWNAPKRWAELGSFSNGLGTTIDLKRNSSAFRWVNFAMKAFALISSVMAIGGAIATIGWIWKAL
jgi:hypothetical protein